MMTQKRDECERILRANLKERAAELAELWRSVNDEWGYEDGIYRFYHQSFEVYRLQNKTAKIMNTLQSLAPGRALHPWFQEIVQQGTGRQFTVEEQPALDRHDQADRRSVLSRPLLPRHGVPSQRSAPGTAPSQWMGKPC